MNKTLQLQKVKFGPGNPDTLKLMENLVTFLANHDKYSEAEPVAREIIRLEPISEQAHDNLGVVLGKEGKYFESESVYREAIRLKSDYGACTQ